ncbi:MAG: membrane protein insertase YidC [Pseudomonadota bacterium]
MDNKNYIIAVALSVLVLILWQVFYGVPQMREQQARQAQIEAQQSAGTASDGTQVVGQSQAPTPSTGTGTPLPTVTPGQTPSVAEAQPIQARTSVIASTPRIAIDTPDLEGSINLQGGRIDDLRLKQYRETLDETSDIITLLSPSGAPNPYYYEAGWTVAPGSEVALPSDDTVWTQVGSGGLTENGSVSMEWDNGEGLTFRRTITLDEHYMFSIERTVENTTTNDIVLYPYALIARHGTPQTTNFYILHEGLIGVLGEDGLREVDYSDVTEDGPISVQSTGGWLGITDKYWATALVPDQSSTFTARFTADTSLGLPIYQTDYLLNPVTVTAGSTGTAKSNVFAGAKQVRVIDGYAEEFGIANFDLLIDWGWFYFLTKPMFYGLDFFNNLTGNFGVAILLITVVIKLIFFPLANKSYVSMSRMKLVQPEMLKIRERFADDKAKQQQAMMELYKKEKINPLSGCWPILIQIPVFFAIYKVLFVTIEMRHAPFFGWIQDLSARDPTSMFNLFGLLPFGVPEFLMIGVWPLLMGITMFIQMKLNPPPPDPTQAMIFNWMPVVFTFILAGFPAGLVIYWAWNNFLSVLQQYVIMTRQGVKVELWSNIKSMVIRKKPDPAE